jgi:3-isopropylmalate/(R)-2-methylmalate dehydratase small subunit
MDASFIRRGACHVFGDDVAHDEGIMAFKYAIERVTDPKLLIPHLFEQIDASFAAHARPGDIVIAGRNFGCGKPHNQGYIAMAALGMAVICESMPHKSLRRSVAAGLPVLAGCVGCAGLAKSGEEVEIDLATGAALNRTTGAAMRFPPMPSVLREIVARGGSAGNMRAWLLAHPELGEDGRAIA